MSARGSARGFRAALRVALLGALGWGAPAGSAAAQSREAARDATGDLFVEMTTPRRDCFVDESVRVTVRLGVESAFLRDHVVQGFLRRLDVPVRLESGELAKLAGAALVGDVTPARDADGRDARERATFALDDQVAEAAVTRETRPDGRLFTVLTFERILRPLQPGDLRLPAPRLRAVWATRFEEDFLHGRVPADRQAAVVEGAALALTVAPLPAADRPPAFTGAIGRFTATAHTDRRELAVGESLRLALEIEGDGDFATLAPPPLAELASFHEFHVLGRIDERTPTHATFTWELVPLTAAVAGIPALPFAWFDPEPPARYRTTSTMPIALAVRPSNDAAAPDAAGGAASREPPVATAASDPSRPAATPGAPSLAAWWSALALAALALAAWTWRRATRTAPVDPSDALAANAAATLRARAAAPGADLAQSFADYLAARLHCTPAAVIAPDLASRLRSAGIPPDLAERTARRLTALVAARYGGQTSTTPTTLEPLVADLERAFTSIRRPR